MCIGRNQHEFILEPIINRPEFADSLRNRISKEELILSGAIKDGLKNRVIQLSSSVVENFLVVIRNLNEFLFNNRSSGHGKAKLVYRLINQQFKCKACRMFFFVRIQTKCFNWN